MVLEDNVAVQVRFDVRQLQLFDNNYRIQKDVTQSLYTQVESALEVITAPVDPDPAQTGGHDQRRNRGGLDAAIPCALGGLNNAQTKMYDIWLSFLATRMQLYLDLERLPLDYRGVWTDEQGVAATPLAAARTGFAPGMPRITTAPNADIDASRLPLVYIDHPFAGVPDIETEPAPVAPVSLRPTFGQIK